MGINCECPINVNWQFFTNNQSSLNIQCLYVLYGGKTSLSHEPRYFLYFKDMRATIMKELSTKWLTALYDHV